METIEDHIEFCILSFEQNGYLKWNFKNYQQFNSNILFKGCYDLYDYYIQNELEYDIKSFKSVMTEYSAELKCKIESTELTIVITKLTNSNL